MQHEIFVTPSNDEIRAMFPTWPRFIANYDERREAFREFLISLSEQLIFEDDD